MCLFSLHQKAVQEILHSGAQSNVKVQITSVARLLVSSVRQIFSVFFFHDSQDQSQSSSHSGLLLATLEHVVTNTNEGIVNASPWQEVFHKSDDLNIFDYSPDLLTFLFFFKDKLMYSYIWKKNN